MFESAKNTCLIIANLWLVGAWLVDDVTGWILMMIMSLVWMITAGVFMRLEMKQLQRKIMIQRIELYNRFMRECYEESRKLFEKKKKKRPKKK